MKLVLTPYWIAEECFLQEALIWAAFYRYPKSKIIPDWVDMRFDRSVQEEYEPRIPDWHGYIESDEAIRVGLPPNPDWEVIINEEEGAMSFHPDTVKRLLESNLEEDHKEKLRQDLIKSEAQAKLQAEWNEKYEAYIELIGSKFFVALREGKIKAFGRKLPHHNLKTAMGLLKKREKNWSWFDMEHEDIPADFWRVDGINWDKSSAQNGGSHYFHIYVNTDELMNVFPAPDGEEAKSVSLVAGQYILNDNLSRKIKKMGPRGRPSLDWGTFYLQVAIRVKNNDLPKKQEAFVHEMQKWCLKNWGQPVGRSTILQRISPFYQQFVTK